MILHLITLYIVLHWRTLFYISLHFITFYYIIVLHYITLCTFYYVIELYITLCLRIF